jgi:hypothetical protein
MEAQTDLKTEPTTEPKSGAEAPAEAEAEKGQGELAGLLRRAERGDKSVLDSLRHVLDKNPQLWREYGDLALQAEAAVGVLACGTNLLLGEAMRRRLRELRDELGGGRSPVEGLLVSRVLLSWMQANHYDCLAAQALVGSQRLRELQKLQDAAHRRHLAALKTLAIVRKLMTPAPSPVQVATRLGGAGAGARGDRVGVPVRN